MAARSARKKSPDGGSTAVYQLRIELCHLQPAIWRRVLVPGSVTLAKLHQIIQLAMGWTDSHLHEFVIGKIRYGIPDPDWPSTEPVIAEKRVTLAECLGDAIKKFTYTYDFGDGWDHELRVEKLLPPDAGARYPTCLAGANACPPEDVGGPPGYFEFLEAIADPGHERHEELLEWCGEDFDATAFDPEAVNAALRRIRL
jgi:hypothetical protein